MITHEGGVPQSMKKTKNDYVICEQFLIKVFSK